MQYNNNNTNQNLGHDNWLVDSSSRDNICNNFESFDSIKPLNEFISIANGLSMQILDKGLVKLFSKYPNGVSPFLLLLKNVYFILECTINLVSTFQLSIDSIIFDLEVLCLKLFGSTTILCSITQINCYYTLDTIPRPKLVFLEFTSSNSNNYLILDPLEHLLLIWH